VDEADTWSMSTSYTGIRVWRCSLKSLTMSFSGAFLSTATMSVRGIMYLSHGLVPDLDIPWIIWCSCSSITLAPRRRGAC